MLRRSSCLMACNFACMRSRRDFRLIWNLPRRVLPEVRRSEEHTSELQSRVDLVCRLLLEKKKVDVVITPWLAFDRAGRRLGFCFFFNDTATTEIYTLSLHDALPISVLPEVR